VCDRYFLVVTGLLKRSADLFIAVALSCFISAKLARKAALALSLVLSDVLVKRVNLQKKKIIIYSNHSLIWF
ncbi:MAG: hypothetical protein D4R63_04320, partial [Methylococcaceae bacterium]